MAFICYCKVTVKCCLMLLCNGCVIASRLAPFLKEKPTGNIKSCFAFAQDFPNRSAQVRASVLDTVILTLLAFSCILGFVSGELCVEIYCSNILTRQATYIFCTQLWKTCCKSCGYFLYLLQFMAKVKRFLLGGFTKTEYARLDLIHLKADCSDIVKIVFLFFVKLGPNSVFILGAPCSAL